MQNYNYSDLTKKIARFIKEKVTSAGFSSAVVAVSGGVDSAGSLTLTARALGSKNVFALFMPYKHMHDENQKDVQELLGALNIPEEHLVTIAIDQMVASFSKTLDLDEKNEKDQLRLGNVMARVRMTTLFDFAKKNNCLVIGTENKSEHYLGYFTRFGDEASDIEPLRNLYKTEVFELARHLGIPKNIIEKQPSANLWGGQTDEGEFGFSYADADQVLYWLLEKKADEEVLLKKGIKKETIDRVLQWVQKMEFKHHLPLIWSP